MHLCIEKYKLPSNLFLCNIYLFHIHLNCPLIEVVVIYLHIVLKFTSSPSR